MRENPFVPKPPEKAPTRGVASHPGFHTADSEEIAAPYAQAKFEASAQGTDYPVIIRLDMQGYKALPDYDADRTIAQALVDSVKYNNLRTLEDVQDAADAGDSEPREPYETALNALFWAHPSMSDPIYALRDELENLDDAEIEKLLVSIAAGRIPPDLLTRITGQYRYLHKVGPDRVLGVGYMKPFYEKTIDWEQEETEDLMTRVQVRGYDVASPFEEATPNINWVFQRPEKPGARVEYHGTSYRRALAAIPSIMKRLPKPPTPYGVTKPLEEPEESEDYEDAEDESPAD